MNLTYGERTFVGMELYINDSLTITQRKKTHKWKWLDRIYRKIYGYEVIPSPDVYIYGNKIIGHSKTLNKLKEIIS